MQAALDLSPVRCDMLSLRASLRLKTPAVAGFSNSLTDRSSGICGLCSNSKAIYVSVANIY